MHLIEINIQKTMLNKYGAFSGVMYGNQVEGGGCIDREHTKCH